jgi:hypothetical protein
MRDRSHLTLGHGEDHQEVHQHQGMTSHAAHEATEVVEVEVKEEAGVDTMKIDQDETSMEGAHLHYRPRPRLLVRNQKLLLLSKRMAGALFQNQRRTTEVEIRVRVLLRLEC